MQVWGGMFLSRSSLLLCVTGWTAVVMGTVNAWELAAPGAGNAGGWAAFSEHISQPWIEDQLSLQSPSGRAHDYSRGGEETHSNLIKPYELI